MDCNVTSHKIAGLQPQGPIQRTTGSAAKDGTTDSQYWLNFCVADLRAICIKRGVLKPNQEHKLKRHDLAGRLTCHSLGLYKDGRVADPECLIVAVKLWKMPNKEDVKKYVQDQGLVLGRQKTSEIIEMFLTHIRKEKEDKSKQQQEDEEQRLFQLRKLQEPSTALKNASRKHSGLGRDYPSKKTKTHSQFSLSTNQQHSLFTSSPLPPPASSVAKNSHHLFDTSSSSLFSSQPKGMDVRTPHSCINDKSILRSPSLQFFSAPIETQYARSPLAAQSNDHTPASKPTQRIISSPKSEIAQSFDLETSKQLFEKGSLPRSSSNQTPNSIHEINSQVLVSSPTTAHFLQGNISQLGGVKEALVNLTEPNDNSATGGSSSIPPFKGSDNISECSSIAGTEAGTDDEATPLSKAFSDLGDAIAKYDQCTMDYAHSQISPQLINEALFASRNEVQDLAVKLIEIIRED